MLCLVELQNELAQRRFQLSQCYQAYFYRDKHPEMGLELNRCRVNSMVDDPHFGMDDKKKPGQCRDGRTNCEDCRTTDLSDILSAHFTICQKPWECKTAWDVRSHRLCSQLHREWFRVRRSFEESRTDELRHLPGLTDGFQPDNFFGYCTKSGRQGYVPIKYQ